MNLFASSQDKQQTLPLGHTDQITHSLSHLIEHPASVGPIQLAQVNQNVPEKKWHHSAAILYVVLTGSANLVYPEGW